MCRMRNALIALAASLLALPAFAHITPNVELVKRGAFVEKSLPGAFQFFEKEMPAGAAARIRQATGWSPGDNEIKLYVGRDVDGRRVGSVVFLWTASEHGPVGLGVAFDAAGTVLAATVTDVASEPLTWVRPLLDHGRVSAFDGLAPDATPDPAQVAPQVHASMPRYYAEVIAQGVERARAVEQEAFRGEGGAGH